MLPSRSNQYSDYLGCLWRKREIRPEQLYVSRGRNTPEIIYEDTQVYIMSVMVVCFIIQLLNLQVSQTQTRSGIVKLANGL